MAGQRGRRPGQKVKSAQTMHSRCDLIFSVARCNRVFRNGRYAQRYGIGAGIFSAAVLEYLTCEILELAGNCAAENKKKTIMPRHLMMAMKNDEEMNKLVAATTISQGGVLPNVSSYLFGKTKSGQQAATMD